MAAGKHPQDPYVLLVQPGVTDPSRAPAGRQTLWTYCHVPSGSDVDMTDRIETQIERFAPGFRDLVLARSVRTAADEEAHNPNYVGGDIGVGVQTLRQTVLAPGGPAGILTGRRSAASTCARRPPRRPAGCTAGAANSPR